jgi:formiminotetrahydrofolate cyclodeaminase
VAELAGVAARSGNANAVSDAGVAGWLARAAGEGALLNVQINLKSLARSADKDNVAADLTAVRAALRSAAERCTATVEAAINA